MKLELTHKQTTGLIMTTEMRQAISLLQYSATELWEHIRNEVDENPIITMEYSPPSIVSHNKERAYTDPIEYMVQQQRDWREELIDQVGWLRISEMVKKVMIYMIGNLDEQGFLRLKTTEIAEQVNVSRQQAQEARTLLNNFEPLGVGCYDFREFLLLQIEKEYPRSELLRKIVADHLEELADRQWDQLTEQLQVSANELEKALRIVQSLEPRPMIEPQDRHSSYILPDLIFEKDESGYVLRDPNSITSQIHWDDHLLHLYHQKQQARDYLDDCYKRASWLIQSIEQRRSTIMRVAEVIFQHQKEFLSGGPLKPLTLKKVAKTLDVHESTVSRAVSKKVIQMPDGIHELKGFFMTGYQAIHGDEYSSQQVKQLIEQMIEQEDKKRPLSDQRLSDELKTQHAIRVSRRTVTKYRESIDVPSSTKRKG